MKLSKMSNRHWRSKLSEVTTVFVVLAQKAESALDQVRETALIGHTLIMQAEPLVLNATETLFHVKKACHSFSSIVDSLGKIDAALTNLQAHVHQGVSHDKAMPDKIRDVAFNQKYPTAGNQVLPLIRKILRHDVVEDWHIEPAKMQSVMIHSEATPMVSEGLGGKVSVATTKICHICQEEAHYTDLDTGKYLCGKHAVPLRPKVKETPMAELPKSASDLFDNILPNSIAKNPDKAREVGAKYAFKVDGEGGGEWTVDLASATPGITKGAQADANCTISAANSDFVEMLTNPAKGMQLFMQGKLRVAGDPMLAMKLQKLFSLG